MATKRTSNTTTQNPAERSFKEKLKFILTPNGYVHSLGKDLVLNSNGEVVDESEDTIIIPKHSDFDFAALEKVFYQYGTYLELIGGSGPIEQVRVFHSVK